MYHIIDIKYIDKVSMKYSFAISLLPAMAAVAPDSASAKDSRRDSPYHLFQLRRRKTSMSNGASSAAASTSNVLPETDPALFGKDSMSIKAIEHAPSQKLGSGKESIQSRSSKVGKLGKAFKAPKSKSDKDSRPSIQPSSLPTDSPSASVSPSVSPSVKVCTQTRLAQSTCIISLNCLYLHLRLVLNSYLCIYSPR